MTETWAMMRKLQEMFGGTIELVAVADARPGQASEPLVTDAQYFAAAAVFCAAIFEWHACACLDPDPVAAAWYERGAALARGDFHQRLELGRAAGARFAADKFAERYGLSELELETVLYLHFCELRNATPWPQEHALAELKVAMTPGYTAEQRRALVALDREDAVLLRDGLLEPAVARKGMVRLSPAIHAQLAARETVRRKKTAAAAEFPIREVREAIWHAALPPALAVAEDVDILALAKRFVFTGRHIRHAVRNALRVMAGAGRVHIEMADLECGAMTEWRCQLARPAAHKASDAA